MQKINLNLIYSFIINNKKVLAVALFRSDEITNKITFCYAKTININSHTTNTVYGIICWYLLN